MSDSILQALLIIDLILLVALGVVAGYTAARINDLAKLKQERAERDAKEQQQ